MGSRPLYFASSCCLLCTVYYDSHFICFAYILCLVVSYHLVFCSIPGTSFLFFPDLLNTFGTYKLVCVHVCFSFYESLFFSTHGLPKRITVTPFLATSNFVNQYRIQYRMQLFFKLIFLQISFESLFILLKLDPFQRMRRWHHLVAVALLIATWPPLIHNQIINQNIGGTAQNPTINQVSPGQIFSGTGNNPYYGGETPADVETQHLYLPNPFRTFQ